MTTAYRNRLSVSALAAATSFIALAAPAAAQSVCTQTGTLVTCDNGGTVVTLPAGISLDAGATQGIAISSATAALPLTIGGTITTTDASPALFLVTTGDLTITAPTGGAVDLTTTGTGSGALLASTGGNLVATLGAIDSAGAWGIRGFGQTSSSVTTTGSVTATGVTAQPIPLLGGSFGTGALAISPTGPAALTINGDVTVTGTSAGDPIIGAFSVAPDTTLGVATTTVTGLVNVDATGGTGVGAAALGGTAATVDVAGPVTVTSDDSAIGLLALGGAPSATPTGTASVIAGGNVNATGVGSTGSPLSQVTGIFAQGTTVNIDAPNATVTATDTGGTNAIGVYAIGIDGVTVNTGKVTSTGAGVVAQASGTAAPVDVTVNGVEADTIGIFAQGTGGVSVTSTAPVSATNGDGIFALRSGTGSADVTVTENGSTGTGGVIAVNAGTGNVMVNANGGLTTATTGDAITAIATDGSATVSVAQGATVTGQAGSDAINVTSGTGTDMTNTVNIAGTVNVAPTGTGNAITTAGGPATVNVNNHGNLSGPIVLGGADNVIAVNSGGTFTAGSVDFGTGNTALTVATGGTLTLNSATAFTGLQTLSNGGTTTLTGDVVLAGPTTFTNTGTVKATGGATSLSGPATFSNAGTISMVDGDTTDVLTLGTTATPMNYVGVAPNARLAVDVNGAVTASDKLVVTGTSSGTTLIAPTFVGGVASYNPTGTVVVNTGGTPAAGTFVIDPTTIKQGWLNAGVVSAAATGGGTNVFVRTTLDSSVTDLALVRSLGQDMWYQSFDAYDDAVRGRHAGSLTTGQPIGIWGQLYASGDSHGDKDLSVTTAAGNVLTYSGELRTLRKGAQVGIEYRAPGFVIGATGGYEKAENRDSTAPSQISADGHNWGIYALVGMENGLYAGVLYKRDDQDIRFFNTVRGVSAYFNNARSEGADGEVGFKGTAGSIGFDLQGGVSYVKTSIGTNSAQGLYFRWDNNKSVRGRLGARVFFPQALGFYLGAKVIHEFNDPADFHVVDISTGLDAATIVGQNRGTWARVEAGVDSLGIKGLMLSVWGDAGKTKSIGGRVGFRF
jgi:hypothetical protein